MADEREPHVLDRRQLIKRGVATGGAMIWAVPVVQSVAGPAFASTAGSPNSYACSFTLGFAFPGEPGKCVVYASNSAACCATLAQLKSLPESTADEITAKFNALLDLVTTGDCAQSFARLSGPCTPPSIP